MSSRRYHRKITRKELSFSLLDTISEIVILCRFLIRKTEMHILQVSAITVIEKITVNLYKYFWKKLVLDIHL